MQNKLQNQPIIYLKNSELALEIIEKNTQIMDPINVLKRGFSITYLNGTNYTNAATKIGGDKSETKLYWDIY